MQIFSYKNILIFISRFLLGLGLEYLIIKVSWENMHRF